MRAPLTAFLAHFPPPATAQLAELAPDPAFSAIVTTEPGYVWPDILAEGDELAAGVVLLTAPGAMGKSAAARAIASALRAPLVDLSKLRVGSNSLTGLLTQVLGWGQAPSFIQALQQGAATIVLDGLDEAQLASGRDNFEAFLGDIRNLLASGQGVGQVVMLGRPDAVETTYYGLATIGLEPQRVELAPLSLEQSCDLIDSALDARTVAGRTFTVHRTHRMPFGELRDRLFRDIGVALTGDDTWSTGVHWQVSEGFLGYPPVLLALAERLAVENPAAEIGQTLNASDEKVTAGSAQGDLLRGIVEWILDRESGKVQRQMIASLGIGEGDKRGAVMYLREEQALRLIRHVSQVDFDIAAPAALAPLERAVYEEQIGDFVPDHPFLSGSLISNVVFSDYARAFAVTSPSEPLHLGQRGQLLGALPAVGPFFASFVHALARFEGGPAVISEDLVSDLIRSNAAASRGSGFATYNHIGDSASLTLQADSLATAPGGGEAQEFQVGDPDGVLELESPLARALVITEHGVVLSAANGTFTAGPGTVISAGSIEIGGELFETFGVNAQARREFGCFMIASDVTHDAKLRVSAHPPSDLIISWPQPWHQWKPYARQIRFDRSALSPRLSQQVLLGLRRILTGFHSSVQDDPSAYCEKFERFAVGTNPVFQTTLAVLMNIGIVAREGQLYRLRLEVLSRFGVSYAALHGSDFAATLEPLLAEVSKSEEFAGLDRKRGT